MYKTNMKYFLITSMFLTQLSLNSFAMDEEENINNILKTVTKCKNYGSQRIYCKVVNNDGGGLLCDYHDDVRINNLKDKLEKIKQKKTLLPIEEEIQDLKKGGEKALRNKQSEELQKNQTANKQNQKIGQNILSTKKLEDRYGK